MALSPLNANDPMSDYFEDLLVLAELLDCQILAKGLHQGCFPAIEVQLSEATGIIYRHRTYGFNKAMQKFIPCVHFTANFDAENHGVTCQQHVDGWWELNI